MKVAVFGATGRTGRLVVELLLAEGHEVTAVTRRDVTIEGARVVELPLTDGARIAELAAAQDAVISALASTKSFTAGSTLARALAGLELRYVCIAGAAVDAEGDRKALPDRLIGWLARTIAGAVVTDRQVELGVLEQSRLRWTMLRPPRLVDGPPAGKVRRAFDTPPATKITRADLAAEAVRALGDDSLVGRAPFVANRRRSGMEVIYGFDPLCGWCYGAVPAVARLREARPDLPVRLVMAGLVTGARVGPTTAAEPYLLGAVERLRDVTGRAPTEKFWELIRTPGVMADSAPPSVAIAAVPPGHRVDFAERVILAHFEEGADVNRVETFERLAGDMGIAVDWPDLQDPARAAEAWVEGRRMGISSFPTFALRDGERMEVLPSLYDPEALVAEVARRTGR